jgi:hypothetical protein
MCMVMRIASQGKSLNVRSVQRTKQSTKQSTKEGTKQGTSSPHGRDAPMCDVIKL